DCKCSRGRGKSSLAFSVTAHARGGSPGRSVARGERLLRCLGHDVVAAGGAFAVHGASFPGVPFGRALPLVATVGGAAPGIASVLQCEWGCEVQEGCRALKR